jgi:hypothetical protein
VIAEMPHRIWMDHTVTTGTFTRRLVLPAYDYVHLWLTVEALNGSPDTASLTGKIQATDPIHNDGVTGEWIDIDGAAFTEVTHATSLTSSQVITLEPADLCSTYMRVSMTAAFSGGSSPSFTASLGYVARRSLVTIRLVTSARALPFPYGLRPGSRSPVPLREHLGPPGRRHHHRRDRDPAPHGGAPDGRRGDLLVSGVRSSVRGLRRVAVYAPLPTTSLQGAPPMDKITAKTGDAPIKKLGHTSGNLYGQNPHRKSTMRQAPKDQSAK